MIDLRKEKILDLTKAKCLKEDATYLFEEEFSRKKLIAKFIVYYKDENDAYLITEFKKMALLSAEPEIATVYFLASGDFGKGSKSCYVMDFVEGSTLRKIIDENKNLTAAFVSDVLGQLAAGMEKAHYYEISHGDLHEENIMINSFGNVKIIDFLWWDIKLSFKENSESDFKSFKLIVKELFEKLNDSDKKLFSIQNTYLSGISSFIGVSKSNSILSRVSNELSLIDDHSKEILALIIHSIIPEANLMYVLETMGQKIPENFIPELTEKDKQREQMRKKMGISLDSYGMSIQEQFLLWKNLIHKHLKLNLGKI